MSTASALKLDNQISTETANDNTQIAAAPAKRFTVNWHGQTRPKPAGWLVRNWVPDVSFGLFVGESGAGKTFAAVRLAVAAAIGGEFLGEPVKQGGTLYVPAEAPDTVYERLDAARRSLAIDHDSAANTVNLDALPIAVVKQVPNLADQADVDALIDCARDVAVQLTTQHGCPLRIIIIDTMLAAFSLPDWNGSADTTTAMMTLSRISRETGATVIGVHHHGKDTSRGAAGSYALIAHADFAISLFRDADDDGEVAGRWAALTKLRRGKTGLKQSFEIMEIDIGLDADGNPAIAGYLVLSDAEAPARKTRKRKTPPPSKGKTILIAAIESVAAMGERTILHGSDTPVIAASAFAVRNEFVRTYPVDSDDPTAHPDTVSRAYGRAMEAAVADGSIKRERHNDKDWIWIPKGPNKL